MSAETIEAADCELVAVVEAAQRGDEHAWHQLVTEYQGIVYAIALRRLRNHANAQEVAQAVFVRAFRKIDQLREPERFVGWLKRIATNLAINHAVRDKPHQESEYIPGVHTIETNVSAVSLATRNEEAVLLMKGMSTLKKLDREMLTWFYLEGMSLQEMSEAEGGTPIGTIKRRLHTARGRLKEALGHYAEDLQSTI